MTEILLNSFETCRLCFVDLNNISSSFDIDDTLIQQIKELIGYFNSSEKLSRRVCSKCKKRLNESFEFRREILGTQSTLNDLLKVESEEKTPDLNDSLDNLIEYCEETEDSEQLMAYETAVFQEEDSSVYPILECAICYEHFQDEKSFSAHIHRGQEQSNDFECDMCSFQCEKKLEMKWHHQNVHLKQSKNGILCNECGRIMRTLSDLRRHQLKQHQNVKRFKCALCEFTSFDKSGIMNHGKRHLPVESRNLFSCNQCGKLLSTKSNLEYHITAVHEKSNKPHVCDICSKSFSHKVGLTQHQRCVHQKANEYQCDICKVYMSRYYLKKHKELMHPADGRKIEFPCEICQQIFFTERSLKNHQVNHREPEFECEKCDKKFFRKSTLLDHQEHHEVLKFPCDHCHRSFRKQSQLRSHLKTVHLKERRTYRCELCSTTFTRRTTYRDHVLRVHIDLESKSRSKLLMKIAKMLPEEKTNRCES